MQIQCLAYYIHTHYIGRTFYFTHFAPIRMHSNRQRRFTYVELADLGLYNVYNISLYIHIINITIIEFGINYPSRLRAFQNASQVKPERGHRRRD